MEGNEKRVDGGRGADNRLEANGWRVELKRADSSDKKEAARQCGREKRGERIEKKRE